MPKVKESRLKESTNEERKERRAEGHFKSLDKKSLEEELKMFDKSYKDFTDSLTGEERTAIVKYTGHIYDEINDYLRKGRYGSGENPYYEELIRDATTGLNKFTLDRDMTFYRKSGDALFNKILFSDLGVKLNYSNWEPDNKSFINEINALAGTVVRDKGFTSSSTQRKTWNGHVHMEIRVPAGTKGAYVDPMSTNHGEREFLFNRGTYFKIVGAREYRDPKTGSLRPLVTLQVVRSSRNTRKKLGQKKD